MYLHSCKKWKNCYWTHYISLACMQKRISTLSTNSKCGQVQKSLKAKLDKYTARAYVSLCSYSGMYLSHFAFRENHKLYLSTFAFSEKCTYPFLHASKRFTPLCSLYAFVPLNMPFLCFYPLKMLFMLFFWRKFDLWNPGDIKPCHCNYSKAQ